MIQQTKIATARDGLTPLDINLANCYCEVYCACNFCLYRLREFMASGGADVRLSFRTQGKIIVFFQNRTWQNNRFYSILLFLRSLGTKIETEIEIRLIAQP